MTISSPSVSIYKQTSYYLIIAVLYDVRRTFHLRYKKLTRVADFLLLLIEKYYFSILLSITPASLLVTVWARRRENVIYTARVLLMSWCAY